MRQIPVKFLGSCSSQNNPDVIERSFSLLWKVEARSQNKQNRTKQKSLFPSLFRKLLIFSVLVYFTTLMEKFQVSSLKDHMQTGWTFQKGNLRTFLELLTASPVHQRACNTSCPKPSWPSSLGSNSVKQPHPTEVFDLFGRQSTGCSYSRDNTVFPCMYSFAGVCAPHIFELLFFCLKTSTLCHICSVIIFTPPTKGTKEQITQPPFYPGIWVRAFPLIEWLTRCSVIYCK